MRSSTSIALALLSAALGATGCGSQEKVCASDQNLCSNACVSLQSDNLNCGACGNACGAGQGCSAGACVDCSANPAACSAEVLAACANLNQVRAVTAGLTVSGAPLDTDALPISFARNGDTFYVANSGSSSISAITLSPPSATSGASAIPVGNAPAGSGDLEYLVAHGGLLWTSNAQANTLVVVDPGTGHAIDELPLPPGPFGSNPQGMAFVGSKAYLALNAIDSVLVLDVSTVPGIAHAQAKTIDVSKLAPAGASAMPSRVLASGSKVFVTLAGLDATFSPPPGSHGQIAVIDTITDTALATPLDLGPDCLDPSGMALSGTTIWVACGFAFAGPGQPMGGALVPIDASATLPTVGTPIKLSGRAAGSVAICDGRGYAGATESGNVISFDPANRVLLNGGALVCPPPTSGSAFSYVPDVICAR